LLVLQDGVGLVDLSGKSHSSIKHKQVLTFPKLGQRPHTHQVYKTQFTYLGILDRAVTSEYCCEIPLIILAEAARVIEMLRFQVPVEVKKY